MSSNQSKGYGFGVATQTQSGQILECSFYSLGLGDAPKNKSDSHFDALLGEDSIRKVKKVAVEVVINLDEKPKDAADVYLRLHLLSHRLVAPHAINLDGINITSGPELQEQVAKHKPGDKVAITYKRAGKENTVTLTLKNKVGNTDIVKNTSIIEKLGGTFENLDKKVAAANEVEGGVVVKKVGDGLLKKSRMQDGFVIISIY